MAETEQKLEMDNFNHKFLLLTFVTIWGRSLLCFHQKYLDPLIFEISWVSKKNFLKKSFRVQGGTCLDQITEITGVEINENDIFQTELFSCRIW